MSGITAASEQILELDRAHVWHPYASATHPPEVYPVASARGVRLRLTDGRELIDGVASWWSAIHGYNHPVLNEALRRQLDDMAHVMFGGLTHAPAVMLAQRLVEITPAALERVFFSDSGSVAVEVAIKMAQQYWIGRGKPAKRRLLAPLTGYHGDTYLTMSVSDPQAGMHRLFESSLPPQLFADTPGPRFDQPWAPHHLDSMRELLKCHHAEIAAVVIEPIVQAYGGFNFYAPAYLKALRALCDEFSVLLICDEIATGFGRTGRLFACEHAGVAPDILCLGKALTGGYLTLAATLCTNEVATGISDGTGAFMHGPTFMANPLACAVANASVELLLQGPWQQRVATIEAGLRAGLAPAAKLAGVRDVRTLGAIGVIELEQPVAGVALQRELVQRGVWVRPFGRWVYAMPPLTMEPSDIATLTQAMVEAVATQGAND